MKRIVLAALLSAASGLWAAEIQTDNQASITVRTRTEIDVDVGDPSRYGLSSSVPELALYYGLSPWQKVGAKPRSASPQGFITFDLDAVQLRYTNGAQPDYNSPDDQSTGFGFNDPHDTTAPLTHPGYFGPVYMPNMRSGIVWGDWTLQLATAGGFNFANPWNHEYEYANAAIQADWALLDTRVQFRRTTVADYVANRTAESNYWSYDGPGSPTDSLSSIFSTGALIGVEYSGKDLAARVKGSTRYTLAAIPAGKRQALNFGTDAAYSPLKALTITGSVASKFMYDDQTMPDVLAAGAKVAYTLPLVKGLEFMPVVGYDFSAGLSGTRKQAQEGSVAATVKWSGNEGWQFDYLRNRTGTVFPGATVAWKFYDADVALTSDRIVQDFRFSLFEDQGDTGLVKGLGSEWVVEILDVTDKADVSLSSYLDWTFKAGQGKIIPWGKVFWDNLKSGAETRAMAVSVDAGVKLDQLIPKVQFGLTWESGELIQGDPKTRYGIAKLYAEVSL